MCDTNGVIYKGRTEGMNPYKERFAADTDARTLAEALVGADVFFGLSAANCVTPEMVQSMAREPGHLRPGQPGPGDPLRSGGGRPPGRHHRHRPLGLSQPGQQRPRLPVHLPRRAGRARHRHQRRDEAGRHPRAGGAGAARTCPIPCGAPTASSAWSSAASTSFPKPFDPRVLIWEASAVAQAAMETGVAQQPSTSTNTASNWSAGWARPTKSCAS